MMQSTNEISSKEDMLSLQPDDMILEIKKYLSESDIKNSGSVSKKMHALFQPNQVLDKFLQRVAYGMQDKVKQLFTDVYSDNTGKIQEVLRYRGRFTDHAGRAFNCTAYEYAYWAKDTHMCRMLEGYMDEETKVVMAALIDEINRIDDATCKPVGLVYSQEGQESRSTCFDFTPLIEAYQRYLAILVEQRNGDDLHAAWLDVGKKQRNVPAHVAQEYCRLDRSFNPVPEFNEATLPRVLTFNDWQTKRDVSWFPLALSNTGLGFDFAVYRSYLPSGPRARVQTGAGVLWAVRNDLTAIIKLDEVRTADLTLSREHLNASEGSCCMIRSVGRA